MKLKNYFIWIVLIIGNTFIYSCNHIASDQENSIKIGGQIWMTNNLDVRFFRNGDPIQEVKTNEEWKNATDNKLPAWCYYENDSSNGTEYGKLYNWYAINDPRRLAPEGWHIPSREEWNTIQNIASKNTKLFSENLGGFRHLEGNFGMMGLVGYWASSTETEAKVTSWIRQFSMNMLEESNTGKGTGLSVLCIKSTMDTQ